MAIHNLFPQPVGMYKLDRDLTEKELDFIKGQETRPNMGNATSTNNTILRHKAMTKLRDFIESSVSNYFTTVYNPKHKVNLRITQSWTNYTEPGQWHHKHAHPNSFVSGVFYPQANKETDKIYFYRDGFQMVKLPPENYNSWNSESWWFDVGTGDLILFPSSLEHMVETVQGDQTRISLSFNTFPVGNIGEEVSLTGLQIGELMAHYAFLDENNIVTEVIVGKNEGEEGIDWEVHYGAFRGQPCKRTSYNTHGGVHSGGGTPYRKNYAGIGYTYDADRDAFIPPKPYASWLLNETHLPVGFSRSLS
jgi:uncharacterized protein (TIGR02466 family)